MIMKYSLEMLYMLQLESFVMKQMIRLNMLSRKTILKIISNNINGRKPIRRAKLLSST
jgi:hypothetical protein